jgi:hypothetical protein
VAIAIAGVHGNIGGALEHDPEKWKPVFRHFLQSDDVQLKFAIALCFFFGEPVPTFSHPASGRVA